MKFKTEQEKFWNDKFGNQYIERNKNFNKIFVLGKDLLSCNINHKFKSCIEFGANIGLNLDVIKKMFSTQNTCGVEINQKAFDILKKNHPSSINCSILDYNVKKKFDLVIVSNFLIHINPKFLNKVYEKMYNSSKKYIYINEYFNPTPVEILYRGHEKKLFKRDFAKEIWKRYPKLKLVNYGFHWSQDPILNKNYGDDDNWFLFSK